MTPIVFFTKSCIVQFDCCHCLKPDSWRPTTDVIVTFQTPNTIIIIICHFTEHTWYGVITGAHNKGDSSVYRVVLVYLSCGRSGRNLLRNAKWTTWRRRTRKIRSMCKAVVCEGRQFRNVYARSAEMQTLKQVNGDRKFECTTNKWTNNNNHKR